MVPLPVVYIDSPIFGRKLHFLIFFFKKSQSLELRLISMSLPRVTTVTTSPSFPTKEEEHFNLPFFMDKISLPQILQTACKIFLNEPKPGAITSTVQVPSTYTKKAFPVSVNVINSFNPGPSIPILDF
jgi:hypothetical protein